MKIKFLMHVGSHIPGEVADIDDKTAEMLCKKTIVDKGGVLVEQRKAMPVAEVEKMKTMPVDMRKISQHELAEMGRKNIVPTPKDPAFEAQLQKAAQSIVDKKSKKKEDAE